MQLTVAEVTTRVGALKEDNVVFTGGEPLLQQRDLSQLGCALKMVGKRIEVETSGTIRPVPELSSIVDQWNVSPKLRNSKNPEHKRLVRDALDDFAGRPNAFFKFVVVGPDDLAEVDDLVTRFSLNPRHVLLMPEGRTQQVLHERSAWLAPACQAHQYRFTTRMHVILWGDERGR